MWSGGVSESCVDGLLEAFRSNNIPNLSLHTYFQFILKLDIDTSMNLPINSHGILFTTSNVARVKFYVKFTPLILIDNFDNLHVIRLV
ncbi:hypothetical protein EDL99_10310 [Ornithobacterium rhinotracheale]|nr:hypothetical protein [Ornithobacterium rhinotracheale]